MLTLVCVSDTHGRQAETVIPDGDVLVHAGDNTLHGELGDVEEFDRWLDRHRFRRDPDGYLRGLEAKLNHSGLSP